jgi:phage-related protein
VTSKQVFIDRNAKKEIRAFPDSVLAIADGLFNILKREGKLDAEYAKKIERNIFEIRIKHQGQWRILYAYAATDYVIVLSGFLKKTQKTPLKELGKARKRLAQYL